MLTQEIQDVGKPVPKKHSSIYLQQKFILGSSKYDPKSMTSFMSTAKKCRSNYQLPLIGVLQTKLLAVHIITLMLPFYYKINNTAFY